MNQTSPSWEWIIIDDGSTDNSWEKLLSLQAKDERIRLFQRNRAPKGACTCRNIGIDKARGDYLLFLDSDDLLSSTAIETRINHFRNEDIREGVLPVFPSMTFEKSPKSGYRCKGRNETYSFGWRLVFSFPGGPLTLGPGHTGPCLVPQAHYGASLRSRRATAARTKRRTRAFPTFPTTSAKRTRTPPLRRRRRRAPT